MAHQTPSEKLAALRGQQACLPDLRLMFKNWPLQVNPNKDAIIGIVHEVLQGNDVSKDVERKLKNEDLSTLIAYWYPHASLDDIEIIAHFTCWMYIVDDEVVDKSTNEMDFDAAYQELGEVLKDHLGLGGKSERTQQDHHPPAINTFIAVGDALRRKYSLAQRERFYHSFVMTMEGYRIEQRLRFIGRIPDWEEYCLYRQGSSCQSMCVAMIELAIGAEIAGEIWQSEEIQQLTTETIRLCWLCNDLCSMKKEVRGGFVENAVVLHTNETSTIQDGIDATVRLIQQSIKDFEKKAQAANVAFGSGTGNKTAGPEIQNFIVGCRNLVKGFATWSAVSPRYGLSNLGRDAESRVSFVVGE